MGFQACSWGGAQNQVLKRVVLFFCCRDFCISENANTKNVQPLPNNCKKQLHICGVFVVARNQNLFIRVGCRFQLFKRSAHSARPSFPRGGPRCNLLGGASVGLAVARIPLGLVPRGCPRCNIPTWTGVERSPLQYHSGTLLAPPPNPQMNPI